ncbi:MAG TPA: hypothetical protein VNO21_22000 [Polyangiaceae bacterium]|nr:hypothetical protein [Polyangiaceae bacterium]
MISLNVVRRFLGSGRSVPLQLTRGNISREVPRERLDWREFLPVAGRAISWSHEIDKRREGFAQESIAKAPLVNDEAACGHSTKQRNAHEMNPIWLRIDHRWHFHGLLGLRDRTLA